MNYYLMREDAQVAIFSPEEGTYKTLNDILLPINMKNTKPDFADFKNYLSSRILQSNRANFKEILNACNIDDQSDINISIISNGLSFRDSFWIKGENEKISWDDINLYENEFSKEIQYTALTGEIKNITLGDNIYTGELSGKGTRPKCYIRQGEQGNIFLAKAENNEEILSEILSYNILYNLNIPSTKYIHSKIYGKDCSVCKIGTSKKIELFHSRDYMIYYKENKSTIESNMYKHFMQIDPNNFVKMQLFDCVTLNTDRNRDNYGIKVINGKEIGLFPLYDHDSCFKGKSLEGHYFVTGTTFKESIEFLKIEHPDICKAFYSAIKDLDMYEEIKKYKGEEVADNVTKNIEFLGTPDKIMKLRFDFETQAKETEFEQEEQNPEFEN